MQRADWLAASRVGRRGRRDPEVLTDLDVEPQRGQAIVFEEQGRTDRHELTCAEKRDRFACARIGAREVARLVELAVVRQVCLRHHAKDAAPLHDGGAVEQGSVDPQRQADDRQHRHLLRGRAHAVQSFEASFEQRLLMKEVIARVTGKPELRKNRDQRTPVVCLAHQRNGLLGIECGIGHANERRCNGDTHEAVPVNIEKLFARGHRRLLQITVHFCGPVQSAQCAAFSRGAPPHRPRERRPARRPRRRRRGRRPFP